MQNVIGIADAICSQMDAELYNLLAIDSHIELIEYIHSLGAVTYFLPVAKSL